MSSSIHHLTGRDRSFCRPSVGSRIAASHRLPMPRGAGEPHRPSPRSADMCRAPASGRRQSVPVVFPPPSGRLPNRQQSAAPCCRRVEALACACLAPRNAQRSEGNRSRTGSQGSVDFGTRGEDAMNYSYLMNFRPITRTVSAIVIPPNIASVAHRALPRPGAGRKSPKPNVVNVVTLR